MMACRVNAELLLRRLWADRGVSEEMQNRQLNEIIIKSGGEVMGTISGKELKEMLTDKIGLLKEKIDSPERKIQLLEREKKHNLIYLPRIKRNIISRIEGDISDLQVGIERLRNHENTLFLMAEGQKADLVSYVNSKQFSNLVRSRT